MAKSESTNYTAAGTQFPIATAAADPLLKEDLFELQAAVEQHTHDSTRGLAIRRINTASPPASSGQVQIDTDDLKWWASSAAAVRTATSLEAAQTWTGQQRFNSPLLIPHVSTPSAPGAGLSVIYAKADGLYQRVGTGAERPVGAPPGMSFVAGAMRSLGTPGTWAEYRQVTLASGAHLNDVLTFDGTSTEQADFSFPVPPSYVGTPISFLVEWYTSAIAGNAAFRVDGRVAGTGDDLTAALANVATLTTFAAQGTTNRKNLSTLTWAATLPVANDWVQCRFFRVAADALDTINAVDLNVLSVTVAFG